jgi:hypothetical protein
MTYRISEPPLPELSALLIILKQLDSPQTLPWSIHNIQITKLISKHRGSNKHSNSILAGRPCCCAGNQPWSRSRSGSCARGWGGAGQAPPQRPPPAPPATPCVWSTPRGAPPTRRYHPPPRPPLEATG